MNRLEDDGEMNTTKEEVRLLPAVFNCSAATDLVPNHVRSAKQWRVETG